MNWGKLSNQPEPPLFRDFVAAHQMPVRFAKLLEESFSPAQFCRSRRRSLRCPDCVVGSHILIGIIEIEAELL